MKLAGKIGKDFIVLGVIVIWSLLVYKSFIQVLIGIKMEIYQTK